MHSRSIGSTSGSHTLLPILPLVLLVFAWLNPIHKQPWLGFWSDTLAAIAFLLVFFKLAFRFKDSIELPKLGIVFLLISFLPWLQFAFGLIPYAGVAWLNFAYLIGFSLAFLCGWNWEKNEIGGALDFVSFAVLLASVCSVGMQLKQCVFPEVEWWGVPSWFSSRFSGSLGHPNLLGTLHVWGLLSVAWLGKRCDFDWKVSFVLALWLLIGISLVESRTAWLNAVIVFAGAYFFWKSGRPRFLGGVLAFFALFLMAMYFVVPEINSIFHTQGAVTYRDAYDAVRLDLWRVYFQAILDQPWFGYGFGGGRAAYITGDILNFSAWPSHAHNLLLDVAVYVGLPGLFVFFLSLFFLARIFLSSLRDGELESIVSVLMLVVVLVHTMLEYPLHYAFFLFPFGLILGQLLFRARTGRYSSIPVPPSARHSVLVLVSLVALMTIIDGVKVERVLLSDEGRSEQFFVRQFVLFDQWDEHLRFTQMPKNMALNQRISTKIRNVLVTVPSAELVQKFVEILIANGAMVEAQSWLNVLCKTSPPLYKKEVLGSWIKRELEKNYSNSLDWSACNK